MNPLMKWSLALLPAVLLSGAALQGAPILYEPFDFYGDYVENFINGTSVSEHTGSLKMLSVKPEKPNHPALKQPIPIPADLQTGNFKYTFLVNFRDEKRQFSANLVFATKDEKGTVQGGKVLNARIDWTGGSSFAGFSAKTANPAITARGSKGFGYLPNGRWAKVEIRACKGAVTLWMERDGKMTFEAATRIPADAVLTGLNFASAGAIQLDDLLVEPYTEAKEAFPADGMTLAVPAEGLRFSLRTMVPHAQFTMTMVNDSEKPPHYRFQSSAQTYRTSELQNVSELVDGKLVTQKKQVTVTRTLHDNYLSVWGPGAKDKLYTRPLLQWRYMEHQIAAMIADWDKYGTDVADHTFEFQVTGNQLWVDGSFYCTIPGEGAVKSIKLSAGYPYTEVKTLPGITKYENGLTLDVPLPLPFKDYFPTALCQENQGTFWLECDGYLTRSPFDAYRDCYLRSIPKAQYNKAIVTYSMDSDTEKSTDLTLRLTQFCKNGGRSPVAMAQATVTLPRIKEGEIKTVEMKLPVGDIQDIIFQEPDRTAMDVEVLGGLYEKNQYYMGRYNKPAIKRSSVRVHGIKLFKSPATLMVKNGILGNLFYINEDVHVTAEVGAVKPGTYTLEWKVMDADGKVVETATDEVKFSAAGEKKEIKHPFKERAVGYYDYVATLKEGAKDLVNYKGSYVCIPLDTRKAGHESPYYAWNFDGAHGAFKGIEQWGELFKRFGIRRTMLRGKYSEEAVKNYKLIQGQFPYLRRGTDEQLAQEIKRLVAGSPHATQAIIFHESGGGPFPLELIGGKTEITPEQELKDKKRVEQALRLAKLWRENAPHIKLVIGNSGDSLGLIAQLFRQKYPRDMIDAMGEESVGMTTPPEISTASSYWNLRELARIYGYKDLMPEACYEWKCRTGRYSTPGTNFPNRDRLIALAWGNKLVPIGMGAEYDNSYYNTIWAGGAFSRNPLAQPRRDALINTIFTQVLDQVTFQRMLPTGSQTAYVLEFKRSDGKMVYALWTARGSVRSAIKFSAGAKATHITQLGKERPCAETEILSPIPFYIVADKKMESVQVEMQRTFENEPSGDLSKAVVAAPMDKAEDWDFVAGEDKRIIPSGSANLLRKPGKFTISTVKDDAKGDCIEVKLVPEGESRPLVKEYGFIRLKKPVEIAGTPDTVGVWVKGNSSWGKIFLELEDADGEVWLSAGSGGYGCDTYDWPGLMSLNFDGWHFLQMPLTAKSPVENHSPGDNEWQWQRERTGDGKLTYPLKVRGVGFMMGRKVLNILEMEELKDLSFRLKDFSAY